MAPITVAIAGGTGNLGKPLTKAILKGSWYPKEIGRVLVITRDPNSPAVQELKADGAEIVFAPSINVEVLKGVDVLINTVTSAIVAEDRNAYAQVAVDAGVKVYVPNDFGLDHRIVDFDHIVPADKVAHEKFARRIGEGKLKVISFYTGEFLEYGIRMAPLVGVDYKNRKLEAVGSATAKTSLTSVGDIGRVAARSVILAIQDPSSVPDYVRSSGDSYSIQDLADLVTKLTGDKTEVTTIGAAEYRSTLTADKRNDYFGWLRVAMGNGSVDFSKVNDNELVNPGEQYWKWEKFEPFLEKNKAQWQ